MLQLIKQHIAEELQMFERTFAESLSTDNPMLGSVHEYVLKKTGKQFRPLLVLLSAKLIGEVNETTIDSSIALELLHTASLIHDDVVDDTAERRGVASVHTRWTNKIAILSGDYILSKALNSAVRTNNLRIMKAIANIGMQLSDGELLQLINSRISEKSEANYYTIIRKKTALLFSTCTEVGALSVNANEEEITHLRNFGEHLGICFQLKDDIFDFFENKDLGKPTGNDIRDGKLTLPLIYSLLNSEESKRDEILQYIDNKEFTGDNIKKITKFTHENGGIDYAISQMEIYKYKALKELDYFKDSEIKKSLQLCAEFAANRSN